jgi:hypothetical protein
MTFQIVIEERGWADVKLGSVVKNLDLWKTCGELQEIGEGCENKSLKDYHEAIRLYIKELGFPECSHNTASNFVRAIYEEVGRREAEYEKARPDGSTADAEPERTVDKVLRQLDEQKGSDTAQAAGAES